MLMEHSTGTSHGSENAEKSRPLDLQRVYGTKLWGSSSKKGGSGGGGGNALKRKRVSEGQNGVRKKSKKEVLLSSLSSGRKIKRSGGGVSKGQSRSGFTEPSKPGSGSDQKRNGAGGLGGVCLKLGSDISIPKRPRDLVRRKKVEVDIGTKLERTLSGKSSSVGGDRKPEANGNGNISDNGSANGKVSQNGESEAAASSDGVLLKVKHKKNDDCEENGSGGSNMLQHLKREHSHSSVHNGRRLSKKARRRRTKTKEAGTASPIAAKEAKQASDDPIEVCDDSQDDEENLEANAARMLSSRFDPSCTGFSSGGKSSKLPSSNGLSALVSSSRSMTSAQPNSRAETDVVSSDSEARVLRPRDQHTGKRNSRKRRHFYEVLSRELVSYWVLNRRIKVFWPLDQIWYIGQVIAYDADKNLHHVKYDDRDEEWIDLHNERFKLLLLPSEVPGKDRKKKPRTNGSHERKIKQDRTNNDGKNNSCMESEPIISWLARSARQKSPPFGTRKKHKSLNGSAKSPPPSFSEGKIDPRGGLEVGSSGRNADDIVYSSSKLENSDSLNDRNFQSERFISHECRQPIVYFRRRFRRREQQSADACVAAVFHSSNKPPPSGSEPDIFDIIDLGSEMYSANISDHSTGRLVPDEFIWNVDDSGLLRLSIPVAGLKIFRLELSFPLPAMINNLYGRQSYEHMCEHGTLISVWPAVHLEILFVDNLVGLRFLLFEGCLKQAVFSVCVVLALFCQSNSIKKVIDPEVPVTSIQFRFSGLLDVQRQLVFAFYNFSEIANIKWSYLDRKLKRHCLLTKQLPPSECTYDNIKALRNGCNQLPLISVSDRCSLETGIRKTSKPHRMSVTSGHSACVMWSRLSCDRNEKVRKIPPFALSFAAAPTFFLSLHLKLLMERSIPSSSFVEQDPIALMDISNRDGELLDSEIVHGCPVKSLLSVGGTFGLLPKGMSELQLCSNVDGAGSMPVNFAGRASTTPCQDSPGCPESDVDIQSKNGTGQLTQSEHCVLSKQILDANDQLSSLEAGVECDPSSGMTMDTSLINTVGNDAAGAVQNGPRPALLALDVGDNVVHSPSPAASCQDRVGSSNHSESANLSRVCPDVKQDILRNGFGNGPKKPRTQVSFSLPFGGHDHSLKSKFSHTKGFSHKRIRRASEKKISEAVMTSQRNPELLSCDANVLVTAGDRGWRQCGVRVVLELVDSNEWRLAVKVSGNTKYSYKAHQFLQPGTTNRYTHAMMWKGGKDWILEFSDRSQWAVFKVMHEECYNRNLRAASVKNFPIPGVRLVEENDDSVPEVPFVRPSAKYYRQVENDIDIAMDPSRVLYDMDSDDERWIAKHRRSDLPGSGCVNISDELFEKTMDVFEKFAYAKQRGHFSSDELEDVVEGCGPLEAIKIMYEYWQEKRLKKEMPLIRHLQPPLWEKYQQQVKEWEQAIMKSSATLPNGCQDKLTIEKPPMFAFCLKPRGLEVLNRGLKQRSQKKLPVSAIGNVISGDSDGFHLVGRRPNGYAFCDERVVYSAYNQGTSDSSPVLQGSARVFSPRDAGGVGYFSLSSDGSERSHYPKLNRNKSKKLCFMSSYNDQQAFASYGQKIMGKRTAAHGWNMGPSEWHNPMHYQADGFQRPNFEQLDPSDLDEFRLRDAASVARHAATVAKMKRENAQRMLCRADLAMHKAVAAIMTAEAINASYKEIDSDV